MKIKTTTVRAVVCEKQCEEDIWGPHVHLRDGQIEMVSEEDKKKKIEIFYSEGTI